MTKKALIVGINSYPTPYQLHAAYNDRDDLVTTLTQRGFTSISSVMDTAATRSNILTRLTSLVTNAVSGDSIVFAFFGHGTYISGSEPDGRTECICPVDVFTKGPITDDQLAVILAKKKSGVTCDVLLGCCYSGTGTRAVTAIPEVSPIISSQSIPGPIKISDKKVKDVSKAVVPVSGMNHVLWASCKDNQTSWEVLSGGIPRGLYPLYLCWAWRTYPTNTRSQIDDVVSPLVTAVVSTQEPQLEGTTLELSEVPFS